jgi:iron(III) transport system permease protein
VSAVAAARHCAAPACALDRAAGASGAGRGRAVALLAFLAAPLLAILLQALEDGSERFVGLANFVAYAKTPGAAAVAVEQPVGVGLLVTAYHGARGILVCLCADAQLHAFQGLARGITLVPLLAPSLLAAISLIYWFGNQGVLKSWMLAVGVEQIYGAPGIVLAEIFCGFPHALMILVTALAGRTRGCTRRPTRWAPPPRASSSPSRCPAPSTA